MLELMTEILVYLAIAALVGFLLGFLVWGWGRRARIDAARAEGIASVRTSMDGDSSLKTQMAEYERERKRLELALERSKEKAVDLQARLDGLEVDEDPLVEVTPSKPAGPTEEDLEEAASEILDAEIDFGDAQEDEPATATRSLFASDRDIDPRISGIDPDEVAKADVETNQQPSAPTEVPTSLLAERPNEVDDLKRIKGVGKVMEGILNDKGVYLFHQIANFSIEDVAWVNEAIEAFPGRIERDDWVGQAQQLYSEKYGRSHLD